MVTMAIGLVGLATGCQADSTNNQVQSSHSASQASSTKDDSPSEIENSNPDATDDEESLYGDDFVLYDEDGNPIDESNLGQDNAIDPNTESNLDDTNGSYDGSVYHNDYYDFSLVIPNNWYDQEGEALAKSDNVPFPIVLGYAEDPSDVISYLSNFFDWSMTSPVEGVEDQAMIDQMIATFKQVTYDGLIDEGLDGSTTKEYEENDETFADGLKGKVATVTTKNENGTGYATMYLVVLPSHDIVSVTALYDNPAAGDSIMTMLNSINVND